MKVLHMTLLIAGYLVYLSDAGPVLIMEDTSLVDAGAPFGTVEKEKKENPGSPVPVKIKTEHSLLELPIPEAAETDKGKSESEYDYDEDWSDWLDQLNDLASAMEMYDDAEVPSVPSYITPVVTSISHHSMPTKLNYDKVEEEKGIGGDYALTITKSDHSMKQTNMMKEMVKLLQKSVKPCPDNFFHFDNKCYRVSTYPTTHNEAALLCRAFDAKLTTVPNKHFLLRLVWELAENLNFKDSSDLWFWTSAKLSNENTWYWASTGELVMLGRSRTRRQLLAPSPHAEEASTTQANGEGTMVLHYSRASQRVKMQTITDQLNPEIMHYFICEMPECNLTKAEDMKHPNVPRDGDNKQIGSSKGNDVTKNNKVKSSKDHAHGKGNDVKPPGSTLDSTPDTTPLEEGLPKEENQAEVDMKYPSHIEEHANTEPKKIVQKELGTGGMLTGNNHHLHHGHHGEEIEEETDEGNEETEEGNEEEEYYDEKISDE